MNSKIEGCKTVEGLFSMLGKNFKLITMKPYHPCSTANSKEEVRSLPKSVWAGCEFRPQIVKKENMTEMNMTEMTNSDVA